MILYIYHGWLILVVSIKERWTFYVCLPDGDPASNLTMHDSAEEANEGARRYIDYKIVQQHTLNTLDSLLENREITPEAYVSMVRLLRESLNFD